MVVVPGLPVVVMPGEAQVLAEGIHPFLHFPEGGVLAFPHHILVLVGEHLRGTVLSRIPSSRPTALSPVSSMLLADRDLLNKMEAVDKLPEADKATIKAVLDSFILKSRFQQLVHTDEPKAAAR